MRKVIFIIVLLLINVSVSHATILEDQYDVIETKNSKEEEIIYSINYNENKLIITPNSKQELLEKTNYGAQITSDYSPDKKSHASIQYTEDGKHMFILKDGIQSDLYDYILSFKYSANSSNFAYLVRKDGKEIIIKDGVESKKYDSIGEYIFSPDGKGFAFVASKDGQRIIIKDGIEGKKYSGIEHLTYSPDGKSFAFIVLKSGQRYIVKDGIESKPYNGFIHSIVFSTDSSRFAIVTELTSTESIFEYIIKNGITIIKKEEIKGNPYQLTNDLTTEDKIKGNNIINKIQKIIASKIGKEQENQDKIIKLLNTYKIKAKNLKLKQLINYIISGILEKNNQ